MEQNPLWQWFNDTTGRKSSKWRHYFDVYDQYFSRYRGTQVRILEIGIWNGGSLQMWKDYFGSLAEVVGMDIDERCKEFEEDQITVIIGDQTDVSLLESLGEFDIILDDGGHTMSQQTVSFNTLYSHVKPDGIYMVEDTHTSYMPQFIDSEPTFMDFTKTLVDKLHAHYPSGQIGPFARTTNAIHYYDSIVVFEKSEKIQPQSVGTPHA
jgi:cephalosporin hydroxylase